MSKFKEIWEEEFLTRFAPNGFLEGDEEDEMPKIVDFFAGKKKEWESLRR